MMKKKLLLLLLLLCFTVYNSFGQVTIHTESFEGVINSGYTSSGVFSDSINDYFDLIGDGTDPSGNANYNSIDGSRFWNAEDTEDIDNPNASGISNVTIPGINIINYNTINVLGLFGSGNDVSFDSTDTMQVYAQVDGGGYVLIGAFEAPFGSSNGTINQDTNLDGNGDGIALSRTFQEFTFSLGTTGTSLDIRIDVFMTSGGEEVAFDNIRVEGILSCTDIVDWANIQFPTVSPQTITDGDNFDVYAQVYEPGVTETGGAGTGIEAWIGYNTTNDNPSNAGWTWIPATFNTQSGNNDEFTAEIGSGLSPGTYYYASRFRLNGCDFIYGGISGVWSSDSVELIVEAVQVDFCNVDFPKTETINAGDSFTVYAQAYEPGVTNANGTAPGAGLQAWIGYNTSDVSPVSGSGWTWVAATYDSDFGNNDQFAAEIGSSLPAGTYYYASRFQLNGSSYSYGGIESDNTGNFWDPVTNNNGILIINSITANIVITEIMYDTTSFDDEWIEICNVSGSTQDISNYIIDVDGSTEFTFPINTTIANNTCITVSLGSDGNGTYNPACVFTPNYGIDANTNSTNNLNNTSATITIYAENGTTVADTVSYTNTDGASSNDSTLHLGDTALDNSNTNTNWVEVGTGGSPGVNSIVSSCATAQDYQIDIYDGQTIYTCDGTFLDSGGRNSDYSDNENYTITFCSGSSDVLQFIFNPQESDSLFQDHNFEIESGDVLNVYDGTDISGTLITTLTDTSDPGADHFYLYSISSCITFEFISNSSGNDNGWEALISCVPSGCGSNPAPADDFANAPYICNLDGFCATTAGYSEDLPANLTDTGGSCPVLFGGTIENNSWIIFEAASTSITLEYEVPVCYGAFGAHSPTGSEGIQAAIFEYDGSNFTRVSDCAVSDGVNNGTFTLTSSSLTAGNTYYIMTDGSAGSQCDYQITVIDGGSGSGVTLFDAGDDQTICSGNSTTLEASGPSGATYSWTSTEAGFGTVVSNPIVVSPTSTATYTVEITSGLCLNETDTVQVTVNPCTADLMITQYYEGSGNNKWIEIENISGSPISAGTYYLAVYNKGGAPGYNEQPLNGPPNNSVAIPAIAIDEIIRFKEPATLLPAYAVPGEIGYDGNRTEDMFSFSFSGNDIIIISTTNDANSYNQRIDIIGEYSPDGLDWGNRRCFIRKECIASGPSTTFNIDDWVEFTDADVESPISGSNPYLGQHFRSTTTYTGSGTYGGWDNGFPEQSRIVAIGDNYDTAVNGSFKACSLTVNTNMMLDIKDSTFVEIQEDLIVDTNATLNIQNEGQLVMVEDTGTVTNDGNTNLYKITSILQQFDYVYWSSPIDYSSVTPFPTPIAFVLTEFEESRMYSFNTANFNDVDDDFFDDDQNDWTIHTSDMTPGIGYAAMTSNTSAGINNASFSGLINNGVITVPLALSADANTDADVDVDDWNLVGNPYPSALFADELINQNTNINGTLYFWSHSTPISISNPGPDAYNFSPNDYAMYNLMGGTASSNGGAIPSGNIATGQAFFVDAITASSLTFNNSMRSSALTNDLFFRNLESTTTNEKDRMWLNLTNPDGAFSQILIGFIDEATNEKDRLYDGTRLGGSNYINFYSMDSTTHKYGIQGRETFNITDTIKIGYQSHILGDLTIAIDNTEGMLSSQDIFLIDYDLNSVHNLKDAPYTFNAKLGEFNERFEIVFENTALSTDTNHVGVSYLSVFELANGNTQFKWSGLSKMKSIVISDLLGRRVLSTSFSPTQEKTLNLKALSESIYVATISLENGLVLSKKMIKQ